MEAKEDAEEENVVVPITSLNVKIQEYVFLTNQLEIVTAQVKNLRQKRKLLQSDVCANLQEEPNRKRLFTIPTDAVKTFGNSCFGLFLYKRKRTKEFNRNTFKATMIDECMPLLKGNVPDHSIRSFAEQLADNVWDARPSKTLFEIMPQRRLANRKPKKVQEEADVANRKRKPSVVDTNLAAFPQTNKLSDDDVSDDELF